LNQLLAQVNPLSTDRLVFLGDYVDRGQASREVIDFLLELKARSSCVFLRGNHEVMMLDARANFADADGWRCCGGNETVLSYGSDFGEDWESAIPKSHWQFVESTTRYLETEDHLFVHACLDPHLDLAEQRDWVLFWQFFTWMRPHKSGKRVICGHSFRPAGPTQDLQDMEFAICIDTGAAYGGWLTCLDVHSGQYWQANEKGAKRSGAL
jgi:serine/threonine protein phosphatase 1